MPVVSKDKYIDLYKPLKDVYLCDGCLAVEVYPSRFTQWYARVFNRRIVCPFCAFMTQHINT